jgi:hypothetical protein
MTFLCVLGGLCGHDGLMGPHAEAPPRVLVIVLGVRLLNLVLQRSGPQRTDAHDAQDDQR